MTRDHDGSLVTASDVLAADEMAVFLAEKGDRRYAWALTNGRCQQLVDGGTRECGVGGLKLTDDDCGSREHRPQRAARTRELLAFWDSGAA